MGAVIMNKLLGLLGKPVLHARIGKQMAGFGFRIHSAGGPQTDMGFSESCGT